MSAFLAGFAETVPTDTHVVMVLDQAGWHGAKDLVVPDCLTLVPLPSLYGAFDVKLYFQALHLCRAHFSRVVVRSCPEAGSDHAHPSGGIGSGLASARLAIGGKLA
jgi:hypothetical protein